MSVSEVIKRAKESQQARKAGVGYDVSKGQYMGPGGESYTRFEDARFATDQAKYKKQRQEQLGEWDTESGKFYDLMRQGFRQRTQSLASAQQTGGMNALNRAGARSGISFSGIQQAAQANLQGQIGSAQVQAESSYDQKLNEVRSQARDEFLSGRFSFFDSLQAMTHEVDLDKEFSSFQAELADQYSSGWSDFFGAVGQGVGMWASGGLSGLGGIFGGGTANSFAGPNGPEQYPGRY